MRTIETFYCPGIFLNHRRWLSFDILPRERRNVSHTTKSKTVMTDSVAHQEPSAFTNL